MKEELVAKFGENLRSANEAQITESIENLAFLACEREFGNLSKDEKTAKVATLTSALCAELGELEILNKSNAKSVINGAKKALCEEGEKELYSLFYEYDDLRKKILASQRELLNLVENGYEKIENLLPNLGENEKIIVSDALGELSKNSLLLADVLKEASEMAFISVLENGDDIEDTAHYTAKNIAFYAISEGEFTRFRLKEIAKLIIESAIFVANESKNTAPALIRGAVLGVYDAITKVAEKYLDDMSVSPDESVQTLEQKKAQIAQTSDIFTAVLSDAISRAGEPAKSEIEKLAQEEFGGYLSKFKKIYSELGEVLSDKISEMKFGEKAKDLSAQWKEKGERIIENFELDEKFGSIKKEMSEKLSEIKTDMAKNMSQKAREISKKAYESALDALAKMKNKGESK